METISIDRNIQVFKKVFEAESRIIFSTKFGDGKSYFLKKFMESYPVPIAIQQMSVRRCKEFLDIDIDASLREKRLGVNFCIFTKTIWAKLLVCYRFLFPVKNIIFPKY